MRLKIRVPPYPPEIRQLVVLAPRKECFVVAASNPDLSLRHKRFQQFRPCLPLGDIVGVRRQRPGKRVQQGGHIIAKIRHG